MSKINQDHPGVKASPGVGHNSRGADPGIANDFTLSGPVTIFGNVNSPDVIDFMGAICSQGDDEVRQVAITNMLHRARADQRLGHAAYRVLEQIASRCRWAKRYHYEPMLDLALVKMSALNRKPGQGKGPSSALTYLWKFIDSNARKVVINTEDAFRDQEAKAEIAAIRVSAEHQITDRRVAAFDRAAEQNAAQRADRNKTKPARRMTHAEIIQRRVAVCECEVRLNP